MLRNFETVLNDKIVCKKGKSPVMQKIRLRVKTSSGRCLSSGRTRETIWYSMESKPSSGNLSQCCSILGKIWISIGYTERFFRMENHHDLKWMTQLEWIHFISLLTALWETRSQNSNWCFQAKCRWLVEGCLKYGGMRRFSFYREKKPSVRRVE